MQDIINDGNNFKYNNLSISWICEKDDSSDWSHRDIVYNDCGIPVLKLYVGETKHLYNELFVDGTKVKVNTYNNSSDIYEHITNDTTIFQFDTNTDIISAINPGTGILTSNHVNLFENVDENHEIYEQYILVIVEERPTLVEVKWNCSNPLYVTSDHNVDVIGTFTSGDSMILNNQTLISSHDYWFIVDNNFIRINNYEGIAYLDISNKIEDVIYPEPLKIIITKNIDTTPLNNDTIIEWDYINDLISLDIETTSEWKLIEKFICSNDETISHDLTSYCKFTNSDSSIATISNFGVIEPKMIGNSTVNVDYIYDVITDYYSNLEENISFEINVTKKVKYVTWSITNKILYLDNTISEVKVINHYTDDSEEDITSQCSFEYKDSIIKLEDNKIIPLTLGETIIRLTTLFDNVSEESNINESFTIIVLQPIREIKLDKTEVSLLIGEEAKINASILPENATSNELIWSSLNPEIATIDETGCIKAISAGIVNITVVPKIMSETILNNDSYVIPSATCKVVVNAIDVTDLQFNQSSLTLYMGQDSQVIQYKVLPENASNKEVSFKIISDERTKPAKLSTKASDKGNTYIRANSVGTCILQMTSISNPEIIKECEVTVIDNRVTKITIPNGNDNKLDPNNNDTYLYERYDKHNNTDEEFERDEIPRYYVPINNSLQLTCDVLPVSANSNIKWYSSNPDILKCTEDGIITGIRLRDDNEYSLEMYADDNENENSRYANRVWVTAYDEISGKHAVCQVRITFNGITNVNFSPCLDYDPNEHLASIFDTDDYIIYVGESIDIPVILSVQDSDFGPSNKPIDWSIKSLSSGQTYDEIVSVDSDYTNHVKDDIDWTTTTPSEVNDLNKNITLNITGEGVGVVRINAIVQSETDTNSDDSSTAQYYTNATNDSNSTDKNGETRLIVNNNKYKITVKYTSASSTELQSFGIPNAYVGIDESINRVLVVTPFSDSNTRYFVDKELSMYSKYVSVKVEKVVDSKNDTLQPIKGMLVTINSAINKSKTQVVNTITNENGVAYNPPDNEVDIDTYVTYDYEYSSEVFPGEGNWKDVNDLDTDDDSIRVRVLTKFKDGDIMIHVPEIKNIKNSGVLTTHRNDINVDTKIYRVWPDFTLKLYNGKKIPINVIYNKDSDYYKMMQQIIAADDDYDSWAWFSSNSDVFEIKEVERDNTDDNFGSSRNMIIKTNGIGTAKLIIVNALGDAHIERTIEVVDKDDEE